MTTSNSNIFRTKTFQRLDLYLKDGEPAAVTSAIFSPSILSSFLLNYDKLPEESA